MESQILGWDENRCTYKLKVILRVYFTSFMKAIWRNWREVGPMISIKQYYRDELFSNCAGKICDIVFKSYHHALFIIAIFHSIEIPFITSETFIILKVLIRKEKRSVYENHLVYDNRKKLMSTISWHFMICSYIQSLALA